MKSNLITFIGVVIVLLLIGGVWFSTSHPHKNGGEIVLGATLPLSGDLAFLGEGYRNGMNLALQELHGTKFTYRAVFEDDHFDPATAAGTVQKLLSVDAADGLFSFGSPVGNVVSPIAETHRIVHINGIASDQNVAKGDYNFVHWTPPYEESKVLVTEMKKRGITTVALFTTNQPGTLAVASQVKKDFKENGITLVGEEIFNPGEKDMKTHVAKLAGTHPQIYMLVAMSPELEILTTQIRAQGITTPLTSIESFEWTTDPGLFEGMWYVNAADASAEFVAKYKAVYGSTPTVGAANGYDAVKLFITAVEKAGAFGGKPSEEEIKNALLDIQKYSGAVGTLSVDADGLIVSTAVVRQIKDGTPVTIK